MCFLKITTTPFKISSLLFSCMASIDTDKSFTRVKVKSVIKFKPLSSYMKDVLTSCIASHCIMYYMGKWYEG